MDIQIGNLIALNLLWVVAAAGGLLILASFHRRRALSRFASSNLVQRLTAEISRPRRIVKSVLLVTSLGLIALALTDPRWGHVWREMPQKGIDVMFVVDVSKSMLAEDATPSRLERARQQVSDMLDAMHGDRVGLVAFAGDAKRVSPLTTNYRDFKQALAEIGPHSVLRGGTKLGEALQLAADGFLDQTNDHKAIVVFTDGDDQESDPVDVARRLHDEAGIRIFTVGLGDGNQGARIPVAQRRTGTRWLEHHGETVWSKMNGSVLQETAEAGHGAWIPAGTKQVDMAGVYRTYVADIEQSEYETARIRSYIPRFQWLLGPALLLLVLEMLLTDRRRRSRDESTAAARSQRAAERSRAKQRRRRGQLLAPLLLAGALQLGAAAPEATADEGSLLVSQANADLEAGEYASAIKQYQQAAAARPDRCEPIYNEAVANYRSGDLAKAREQFTQALAAPQRRLEAKARFNLGNCDYAEAIASAEQDRETAIAKLKSAISHYRGALNADPADEDARSNIELAGRLIQELRRQEEQEQQAEQEQEQQQQQQEEQKQEQDGQSQQEQQQASSEQQEQEPNSDSSDGEQQDSSDEQESDSQQQQAESSQSDSQGEEPQNEDDSQVDATQGTAQNPSEDDAAPEADADPPAESGEEQSEQSSEQPPADEQGQTERDQTPSTEPSPEPKSSSPQQAPTPDASRSNGADDSPADEQSGGLPQYGSSTSAKADESAQPMTQTEADKLLQSIRDRDLRRRIEQLRAQRLRSVPVDRDW